MGLCCKLKTLTYVAAIFAIFNFLIFVPLDLTLIIGIKAPSLLNTSDNLKWNTIINGLNKLSESNVLIGLLGIRIFLHILWLITVPLILIGNTTNRRHYLLPWETIALIKLIYMLIIVILFIVKHNQCGLFDGLTIWMQDHFTEPTEKTGMKFALFILLIDISDGGPLFWLLITMFICYVHIRGWQIVYHKKTDHLLINDQQFQMLSCQIPRAKVNNRYDNNSIDPSMINVNQYKSYPSYSTTTTNAATGNGISVVPINARCYDNLAYTP